MAKMSKNMSLSHQLDAIKANINFLKEYLPILVKKQETRIKKLLEDKILEMHETLVPFEKAALINSEYLKEEKEYRIKQVEEKYYWKRREINAKKNRLIKNEKYTVVNEKKITSQLEMMEKAKSDSIARINDEYTKEPLNLDEAKAKYQSEFERLNTEYNDFEKSLKEKSSRYIDKVTINYKNRIELLEKRKDIIESQLKQNTIENEHAIIDDDVVLKLDHLSMHFGGLKAVDDLSFEVKKGEIFGLIGPNGAGKTTVFNCITQFYKPKAGNIFYSNRYDQVVNLNKYKVHNVIREGIVRTFQNVELIWEISVLDNLLVGGHTLYRTNLFEHFLNTDHLKIEEAVLRKKAEDILEKLGLTIYKNMIPYGLPYGILKKIELARTLMTNPRLIILDEPAAGLNDAETESLSETIKQIRDEYNATIFLVEHDMGLVMDICDTVCAISFGKKLAIGTPKEIQENNAVRTAYLGGE